MIACVLAANRRLHIGRCASLVRRPRSCLDLCPECELVSLSGYARGCIGPVGLRHDALVLVDQGLLAHGEILVGSGEKGKSFRVQFMRVVRTSCLRA